MTHIISTERAPAQPAHFAAEPDILSGGAPRGARLPRRPIAPSGHAVAAPDVAYDTDGWDGPPVAEADRPVALVIEDDAATRALITDILKKAGWSVRQAGDGKQGLMMAREHVPEVILLDLALPGMSGPDVLRELKSALWADQCTAVMVVSLFAMLLEQPHLQLADGVVQKPFGAANLLAQVALARARHRAPVLT